MKIGIFGGTFNPPHFGHLILAEKAVEILSLDKLIFIPASIPPHKKNERIVAPEHRIKMLKLSIDKKPYFEVSDIEIQRGGTSYTCETLADLKEKFPGSKLFLFVGYDNFIEFHLWKNYQRIFELCKVVVFGRNIAKNKDLLKDRKVTNTVKYIDTPLLDISSTEIRNRIKEEKPVDYYVSSRVMNYIYKNKLYR